MTRLASNKNTRPHRPMCLKNNASNHASKDQAGIQQEHKDIMTNLLCSHAVVLSLGVWTRWSQKLLKNLFQLDHWASLGTFFCRECVRDPFADAFWLHFGPQWRPQNRSKIKFFLNNYFGDPFFMFLASFGPPKRLCMFKGTFQA